MLFKKGYLAKKMVCSSSNNPSTSATPSTTDSQSASHSTAGNFQKHYNFIKNRVFRIDLNIIFSLRYRWQRNDRGSTIIRLS